MVKFTCSCVAATLLLPVLFTTWACLRAPRLEARVEIARIAIFPEELWLVIQVVTALLSIRRRAVSRLGDRSSKTTYSGLAALRKLTRGSPRPLPLQLRSEEHTSELQSR